MKPIAQIFLWYAAISCLLLTVTLLVLGRPDSKLPIEILQQPRTSFQDEACRAIFESRKLAAATKPVMLILGASAAQEAYRPHLLESMIPEYSVNNLALGGANITETRQVLALALKHTQPDLLKNRFCSSQFVIRCL